LLDSRFLLSVWEMTKAAVVENPATAKQTAALADNAAKRGRLIDDRQDGLITKGEFVERVKTLDAEKRALESMATVALPQIGPEKYIQALVIAFARFGKMAFAERRDVLRRAIREVTLDAAGRAIPAITLSGGWLGGLLDGVNSSARLRSLSGIDSVPDLTIRFPQPVQIADSYVDGRRKNGNDPRSRAGLDTGRATRWGKVAA
jgi:hypothetical protein